MSEPAFIGDERRILKEYITILKEAEEAQDKDKGVHLLGYNFLAFTILTFRQNSRVHSRKYPYQVGRTEEICQQRRQI